MKHGLCFLRSITMASVVIIWQPVGYGVLVIIKLFMLPFFIRYVHFELC